MGVHTLVDRNKEFAESFDKGDLAIPPRLSTLIVTCVDARVDPAHFLGLELGEAFVMRNVGGRVTDETIDQIAIMRGLTRVAGGDALAVAVIHHTDCGTIRFADPTIAQTLVDTTGIGAPALEKLAAPDPQTSVREDIGRLHASTMIADDLVVGGYVYDVAAGRLETVRPPAPLRERG